MAAPSVEIFVIVRNEEFFIEYFYEFYKSHLTNVTFSLFDLGSTDRTVEIAKNLGINIETGIEKYFENQTIVEYVNICLKNTKADFVIIQNIDELLDINDDLLRERGFAGINATAYNMVEIQEPIGKITKGIRSPFYDKLMCFRVSEYHELKYSLGAQSLEYKFKTSSIPIFVDRPMYRYNISNFEHLLNKYNDGKTGTPKKNLEKTKNLPCSLSDTDINEKYDKAVERAIHIFPVDSRLSPDYDPLETLVTFYRKHFGALASTIIDIGSRDGDDAKYLKEALNGEKIIAIEADPAAAQVIARKHPNFIVWCTGVSDFIGRSSFQRVISENIEHRGSSSFKSTRVENWYDFETIEIPVTTMSELMEKNFMKNEFLDVVKIDCEGFTYQVLQGFGTYLRHVRIFHLETEKEATHVHHVSTQGIKEFMHSNNFSLVENSSEWGGGVIDQIWVNRSLAVYQKEMLE